MNKIMDLVRSQVEALANNKTFKNWIQQQNVDQPTQIVFNNSYIYRLNLKTTKSDLYLGAILNNDRIDELLVCSGISLNSDFKLVSYKAGNVIQTPLSEAVNSALSDLGMLVFVLISTIDESEVFEVPINSRFIQTLVLDRRAKTITLNNRRLVIYETSDEEAIWNTVVPHLEAVPDFNNSRDEIREKLGQAILEIDRRAYASLHIPAKGENIGKGILDQLSEILDEQIDEYRTFLKSLDTNSASLNNLLRIAYNFSSDATTLIRLIISICDLKPVVLWCTIYDHFRLSEAFKNLPWIRSKYKASLKGYIDTIGDARNSAFHKLFPFRQALDIVLPEGSLRKPVLRIFSEFGRKSENELTYRDKELVSVLTEFTRVSTIKVSAGFWQKNLDVMTRTRDLFRSTSKALKLIHSVLP